MKKRKLFIFAAVAIFLIPVAAFAATFKASRDNLVIPVSDTFDKDLYAASGSVSINGKVKGDVVVAGGQVNVSGEVSDDIDAVGGQISISGKVGQSVRVLGGQITISGDIAGDLIVAGGTVEVQDKAKIGGVVKVGSGQLRMAGESGPVEVATGSVILVSTAKINGDFTYTSSTDAVIESGSTVSGGVTHKKPEGSDKKDFYNMYIGSKIVSFLMTLVAALVYFIIFPNKSRAVVKRIKESFWKNILRGLSFLVLTPVIIVLLLVSFLGLPIGFVVAALYGILLYAGKIISVIVLGFIIEERLFKKDTAKDFSWLAIVVGALLYYFVGLIPVIGWAAVSLLYLSSLGATFSYDVNIFKKLKSDKVL